MADPGAELDRLRATIAVLEEENAQLSEQAEDAMLLGIVAEATQGLDEPQEILAHTLERISILKDLPFISCGRRSGNQVIEIASYAGFTDESGVGYPISLSLELGAELSAGPFICTRPGQLLTGFTDGRFTPASILIIPFTCHLISNGLFLFFARDESGERLSAITFLLDQVVRMVTSRLDNLFLSRELSTLNDTLQEKYHRKTKDLVRANSLLQEAHDRFSAVLDGIDSPIHVINMTRYEIIFLNCRSRETFPKAHVGSRCYRTMYDEEAPCAWCRIPELLAAEFGQDQAVTFETRNRQTGKWFLNREKIVSWPDIPLAKLSITTDITALKHAEEEQRKMQQSLNQAQKLEAVGIMAGSVAHDLNNILSGIVSYPDLLLAGLSTDSDMRRPLETMQAAGRKAATIVRDLLTLSRRGIKSEETVDLAAIVSEYLAGTECLDLLRINTGITILPPEPLGTYPVSGSPAHLSNVLMNLVTNAVEAMPKGGTVSVGIEKVDLTERPEGISSWQPGTYVRMTVADTGIGIPEKYHQQIFDPFFTQKQVGRSGTGLGLAVVWGTVLDHRGYVTVDSTEGIGTTFAVHLPLAGNTVAPATETVNREPVAGRGEKVLVVDDIDNQRKIASDILVHLGYNVTAVESGEAAVSHLLEHSTDLVLLDMIMPQGIDGLETCRRIFKIRPGQKVVIVSGYSQAERIEEVCSLGVSHFVAKPYTIQALSMAVCQALAAA